MRPRVTSVGLIVPPRQQLDFASSAHIDRASLEALPCSPGVYFFRDPTGEPLYIGKSINIRGRILSHLRTPQEMALLQQTSRVDFVRTAGEIGALLLESRLIKTYQPVYNAKLKCIGESFSLILTAAGTRVQVAGSSDVGQDGSSVSYGLFASRSAAEQGLQALVRRHQLCPALMGLEKATHGRACFARQIGRCRGACIGSESSDTHHRRLQAALDELGNAVWPYDGPIGIIEVADRLRQIHVIDRWSYIGSLEGRRRKMPLPARRVIDIDTYKILAAPLAAGRLMIARCEVRQNAAYWVGDGSAMPDETPGRCPGDGLTRYEGRNRP